MAFQYEFELCGKCLLVRTRGLQEKLDQGIRYARDIAEQAVAHGVRYVLLDERQLRLRTSVIEDYELVVHVLNERWHLNANRIACVPHPADLQKIKFFENVAQNRGMNFRMFSTLAEARRWLEQD